MLSKTPGLFKAVFYRVGYVEARKSYWVAIVSIAGLQTEVIADVAASEKLEGGAVLWLIERDTGSGGFN